MVHLLFNLIIIFDRWFNALLLCISGPMDLIAKFKFFKERDVIKMYSMKNSKLQKIQTDNIVFITRPGLDQMDKISDAVKSEEMSSSGSGNRIDFHVLFVPNKSLLCEMRLKGTVVQISWSLLTHMKSLFQISTMLTI